MDTYKEIAVSFLELAATGHAQEAQRRYVATGFLHHKPHFPGDANSLIAAMDDNALQNPHKQLDVKHVLRDGDFVATHSFVQQTPADRGAVVVHIFRFDKGRIVELWDVGEPVPEDSPNANGMV